MKTNWDEIFLTMALALSGASHCVSRQVGALIVKDRRIISTGINGTPTGTPNCDDIFPPKTSPKFNREKHHAFSTANEIHAEMNALLFHARTGGGKLDGATLYCTLQPCGQCLKNLMRSGVKRIVYAETYDLSSYSSELTQAMNQFGIELKHIKLTNHNHKAM
jgi:dCMP deaminase